MGIYKEDTLSEVDLQNNGKKGINEHKFEGFESNYGRVESWSHLGSLDGSVVFESNYGRVESQFLARN